MEYNQQDNKSSVNTTERVVISSDVHHALCHILNRNDNDLPDFLYAHKKWTYNDCFNDLIKALIYKCGFGKYLLCSAEPYDPDSKCVRMFKEDKRAILPRRYWR